jgi:hypothetical protein
MPVSVAEGVNPESAWSCLSAHDLAAYDAWYPEAFCFGAKTGLTLEIVLKAALNGMHTCTSATDRGPSRGLFTACAFKQQDVHTCNLFRNARSLLAVCSWL